MLLIRCPCCDETREEEEFAPAGEAFIARPAQPEALDDAAWADYLFMRTNPKGWHWEMWQHTAGCRKFFVAKRHTLTYAIAGTWTLAEARAVREREQRQQRDAADGSAS
jgi:sarcosine oxidase subunit delta